jgi:hypothetical protein
MSDGQAAYMRANGRQVRTNYDQGSSLETPTARTCPVHSEDSGMHYSFAVSGDMCAAGCASSGPSSPTGYVASSEPLRSPASLDGYSSTSTTASYSFEQQQRQFPPRSINPQTISQAPQDANLHPQHAHHQHQHQHQHQHRQYVAAGRAGYHESATFNLAVSTPLPPSPASIDAVGSSTPVTDYEMVGLGVDMSNHHHQRQHPGIRLAAPAH